MGVFGPILAAANAALRPTGFALSRVSRHKDFRLYEYVRPDGTFDYDKYKMIQASGNVAKIDMVFVDEVNIDFLAQALKARLSKIKFGICHGTRRGFEQKWFSDRLSCPVIGTEISHTATQFPNTIQWDFHEVKPEWVASVDFIYSNSFDHSYDPEKCLTAWMSCIRPGGICVIEHTDLHGPREANELDPFGVELTMFPYLIANWSKGRFGVSEILKAPSKKFANAHFVLLKNFS
jgi:proteasome lid subunit RPN8/RPN11